MREGWIDFEPPSGMSRRHIGRVVLVAYPESGPCAPGEAWTWVVDYSDGDDLTCTDSAPREPAAQASAEVALRDLLARVVAEPPERGH